MKKIKILVAVAIIGTVISLSYAFNSPSEKIVSQIYFEYNSNSEAGSALINAANWTMISSPSESDCPETGTTVCVTQVSDLPVYGAPYNTPEQRFAHYLDLQADDGVSYISTPANRLKEKE